MNLVFSAPVCETAAVIWIRPLASFGCLHPERLEEEKSMCAGVPRAPGQCRFSWAESDFPRIVSASKDLGSALCDPAVRVAITETLSLLSSLAKIVNIQTPRHWESRPHPRFDRRMPP